MGQESSPKVALWALPLRGAGFRCRVGALVHCPLPPAQASLSSLDCRHHVGFIFVPFISPRQIELPGPSKTLRKSPPYGAQMLIGDRDGGGGRDWRKNCRISGAFMVFALLPTFLHSLNIY